MVEQIDRHPGRLGRVVRVVRIVTAAIFLAVPATAGKVNASETSVPAIVQPASLAERSEPINQTIYVDLPDWKCDPRNDAFIRDRSTENFTRPDTSVTEDYLSVTYPVDEEGGTIYQTVVYANTELQDGDILRYYSDSRDCPLPEGVPTIPAENQ
ncbi:MAG: hypothetical protein HYT09_01105 [Candidatus Levybacteria bacterium]|nr:hypothetical protein [Candidatus Levybacteria bacterium]